jgi:predicted esterase
MRSHNLIFSLFILLSSYAFTNDQEQKEPLKQLSFQQKNDAQKAITCDDKTFEKLIENIRKIGSLSKNASDDFIKSFNFPYQQQRKGITKRTVKTKDGERTYALFVPDTYMQTKPSQLIISLHGAGGNGDGEFQWIWASYAKKWNGLIACPSGQPPGAQWFPEQEEFVVSIYKDMLKNFNIDTNRVYVHGFSNGGNGAWYYGVSFPWLFGAICARGGACPNPQCLKNLINIGTYVIHGSNDTTIEPAHDKESTTKLKELGCDVVYVEIPNGPHEPFPKETPKVIEYFNKHTRNPWPNKIFYTSNNAEAKRVYWIETTKVSGSFSLEAEIQDGNKIVITSQGIDEMNLHLSDAIINMDKPVIILLNDNEVHNQIVPRSLETLVMELRQNWDIRNAGYAYLKLTVK